MTADARRIDRASTRVPADPAAVYGAFVDPEQLVAWLPPAGARGVIEAFEPVPGGVFRMRLVFDDPSVRGKSSDDTDVVDGRFVELVPHRAIVQRFAFESDDPAFAGTMTMRWTFTPDGDGTRVSIAAEDVPPGISPEDHAEGLKSSLENLVRYFSA